MSVPDLETKLRSYYERFAPDDSTRLMLASSKLLYEARQPRPRRWLWGTVRLVATLAAATVLLAVVVLPRLGGGVVGPGAGTASPGPTFDQSAALKAQVDEAGVMRTGGIWAVEGSYFLTSTDNGASWHAGTFPSPGGIVSAEQVFVLDPDHAWAITSNGMNGGLASPALPGELFVVNRTSDGGQTWQSVTVSGDYRCDTATLSFVDAHRGFIMCSYGSTSGPNGSNNEVRTEATKGAGTVLRTDDGGATWSVAGSAIGLGSQFTASDSQTLWSAPDANSSDLTGPTLYVSRDGGVTWTAIDLPGMYTDPIPGPVGVSVDDGPTFWDANDGAIAIGVHVAGTSTEPGVWFYRTGDGGRSWALVKEPTKVAFPPGFELSAVVGSQWAVIDPAASGLYGLTRSSDFGATWTNASGFGMPYNSAFLSLDLIDRYHGVATVFVSAGTRALMLTSDGGQTWHAADFGSARTNVSSTSADPSAAKALANNFAVMADKDPQTAWNMLSAYSQKAFGSESAFGTAEAALFARTNYAYQVGDPTQSAAALNQQNLGSAVLDDLTSTADRSRAWVVEVTFPGTPEPSETLAIAPLSTTGEWRIWVTPIP
jgi:hypothetical protein